MVRHQRASKVHEDKYSLYHSRGNSEHQGKDELVKNPPRYLGKTEDIRGKALSFGVFDWKLLENWKDTTAEGTKGACCSYASSNTGLWETAANSSELDLSTGVVKTLERDLNPQAAIVNFSPYMRNDSFSQQNSDSMDAVTGMRMAEQAKLDHQPISPSCPLILNSHTNPGSETSSKLLPEAFGTVECHVEGEGSSLVNVMERNQNSLEKPCLLNQKIPTLISKKGRHASPNRRFSFSFSQMGRSFSSKESLSSVPALSSASSNASAKSGPLTFNDSVYTNHSTRTNPNGHSRTKSGPLLIPKTEKNVVSQMASKHFNPIPPTMEKQQCSSRTRALLQFTLRRGINLFQFVVEDNTNVLAATMKSLNSYTRSYTLYSVKEVKNKSGNWLGRHKNEVKNHPFAHTITGQMKTVTSFTSDFAIHKSESVLFGVESNEELAAIVQTRNKSLRHIKTTIILPSGVHTLPKDGNAPLPLIDRWKSGGACDCGGWDIGCKLRVFSNGHTKSQSFSSFQLFDQERDQPAFKMVTHDDELHSVEFGSSISLLQAFFISLAVSSHQNQCEEEEAVLLIGNNPLKRETSTKYASNPPVSPIGRV